MVAQCHSVGWISAWTEREVDQIAAKTIALRASASTRNRSRHLIPELVIVLSMVVARPRDRWLVSAEFAVSEDTGERNSST